MKDPRFGWRGEIFFKVKTAEEVIKMYTCLEGKHFNVGVEGVILIEVIPHVALVEKARNAHRA